MDINIAGNARLMASSIKFMAAAAGLYALSTQPPLNQVRTLASMRSAVDSACLVLYKTAAGTGRCAPSFPLGRGERRACTGAVAVHASQQAARRFVRRRICCLHLDGSSVLHGCTVACRAMQAAHRSNSSTLCRLTLSAPPLAGVCARDRGGRVVVCTARSPDAPFRLLPRHLFLAGPPGTAQQRSS